MGTLGDSFTNRFSSPSFLWVQDISLKVAFMKSVVQVTNAIRNIKDVEFQFSHKSTLTGLIMVSWVGLLSPERFGWVLSLSE